MRASEHLLHDAAAGCFVEAFIGRRFGVVSHHEYLRPSRLVDDEEAFEGRGPDEEDQRGVARQKRHHVRFDMNGQEMGQRLRPFHSQACASSYQASRAVGADQVSRAHLSLCGACADRDGDAIIVLIEIDKGCVERYWIMPRQNRRPFMQDRLDDILRQVGRMDGADIHETRRLTLPAGQIEPAIGQPALCSRTRRCWSGVPAAYKA